KLMDKKQIQDWLDAGMNIGSHSLNHTNLTKISNNDVIIEIENSKKTLEDMFGVKINNFCYPFGKFNKFTTNVVEERGYLRAFTTNRGLYKTPNFEIKRVPITKGISKFKFWLKTRTIYENI
ncbi:polysaccharide deacetylase family protein, partial [Pelagibacterales bacterium]|nr:polysaccharide deacetylase family protein [Pelagibacterales bacterium]